MDGGSRNTGSKTPANVTGAYRPSNSSVITAFRPTAIGGISSVAESTTKIAGHDRNSTGYSDSTGEDAAARSA
jgi:hypothetical protein